LVGHGHKARTGAARSLLRAAGTARTAARAATRAATRAPRGPFPAGRGEDGEGGNEGGDEGAAAHGGATAAGRDALKKERAL